MDFCAACGVGSGQNPDVRLLFSRNCDDCLCEPCVARLFRHDGPVRPCPACGYSAEAEDFSEQRRSESQQVRREICGVYCKKREDFADLVEYNEYLEHRDSFISRLANPSSVEDVQDVWRQVNQYEEKNREQIQLAHRHPRRKVSHGNASVDKSGLSAQCIMESPSAKGGQCILQLSVTVDESPGLSAQCDQLRGINLSSQLSAPAVGSTARLSAESPSKRASPRGLVYDRCSTRESPSKRESTSKRESPSKRAVQEAQSPSERESSSKRESLSKRALHEALFMTDAPESHEDSGMWAPDSPSSPQSFFSPGMRARHMSGGGQTPSTRLKKARHFFFTELVAGSRALAAGA